MSDKPESLAAVLAEMRDFAKPLRVGGDLCSNVALPAAIGIWADRIEAAAERERNAHTNDIHDALYMATGIPGNAAAMREALEWVAQFLELGVDDDRGADGQNLTTAAEMARDAIASPARNCDRFATAEDARREFEKAHSREIVHNLYTAAFDWLFATAEGGDHA